MWRPPGRAPMAAAAGPSSWADATPIRAATTSSTRSWRAARSPTRSMKPDTPPHGGAGGRDGRTGDIVINPDSTSAKRLPTRYADYPLREGDIFRLDTPGGGGFGDPFERDPERVLADVREGYVSREAAEKDYGVVVAETEHGFVVDAAATARKRNKETP